MKTTVLFLIKHMDTGGGEFVFHSLISGLPSDRFEPILVCLEAKGVYGERLAAAGFTVYDRLLRRKLDPAVIGRLVTIIRRHRVNVVYLMDYRDTLLWGPLAARWAGIPSILTSHCTSWWKDRSLTMIGTRLLGWHSAVVALSEHQRVYFVDERKLSPAKVKVVPNGIDYQKFAQPPLLDRPLLEVPASHFIVGTVSALRPGKNVEMLLRALHQLKGEGRAVFGIIVGDGTERPKIEAYAEKLGIRESVQFLGTRSDVAQILHEIDVFVLSSDFEVMPLSIIEAMAAARPVVSTKVGSVPQIVDEGQTGFTVPVDDHAALAKRLGELMDQPELRRRMGERATEKAQSHYSLQGMIDRTAKVIDEVTGATPGHH